jgi:circadian clock protein KaiC
MTLPSITRLPSGIRNFDVLVAGGVPRGSVVVVAGPPGAGKSILTQHFCFHNAQLGERVLYFNTLSEPTAKTLRHLSQFTFFDHQKIDDGQVRYVDIGGVLRHKGLEAASQEIMLHVKQHLPTLVVIDSFKVFDDLATSREELRRFGYELAVNLMAWETTTFLLGEFGPDDIARNPLFSIIDGMLVMSQRAQSGEQQRFLQFVKLRGTNHSREEYPFEITADGIEVFAPRATIRRDATLEQGAVKRMRTGVSRLDEILGEGIPLGSSLLVAGVAGTGKTLLLLEFIYRGALAGEKGLIVSFEETEERILAVGREFGWDLDAQIAAGMIEILYIPQPDITVEKHLLLIQQRVSALAAQRVAIDSISVFLQKTDESKVTRDKVYQLASVIQNARAVGFLATDIPYGENRISRFGVEETVVDGVILLTDSEEGFERRRYVEIYKLRNTLHLTGRHNMLLTRGGMLIYPRYSATDLLDTPPPAPLPGARLGTGLPTLDELMGGGLLARSVTLVSGSTGIGKSTLGLHFALEGARHGEKTILASLEEGPEQLLLQAKELGLPLQPAVDTGLVEIIYLSRRHVRAHQFLTILSERITRLGAARLVLDGVGHIASADVHPEDLRQMLAGLVMRFKTLGVTSLFTLEAHSLVAADIATDEGFSPLSDNLVVMRYERTVEGLVPYLWIVKTRSSSHDSAAHRFGIGQGGIYFRGSNARQGPG